MSQAQAKMQCQAALVTMVEEGAKAAALVARDGVPILSEWGISANEDLYAAMAAAMYGAADACAMESGQSSPETIAASGGGNEFSVHGLDEQHLLVVIGPARAELVAQIREALQDA